MKRSTFLKIPLFAPLAAMLPKPAAGADLSDIDPRAFSSKKPFSRTARGNARDMRAIYAKLRDCDAVLQEHQRVKVSAMFYGQPPYSVEELRKSKP